MCYKISDISKLGNTHLLTATKVVTIRTTATVTMTSTYSQNIGQFSVKQIHCFNSVMPEPSKLLMVIDTSQKASNSTSHSNLLTFNV